MNRWIVGCVSSLLAMGTFAPADSVRLRVESDPIGLNAWADERYIGRTPLEYDLPAGPVTVRLAYASDSLFVEPVADSMLTLVESDSLTVRFRVGTIVSVRSRPFDLPLFRDGQEIGRTPLEFRLDPHRPGRIDLETPGGRIEVPTDTLLRRGNWDWIGEKRQSGTVTGGKPRFWKDVGRYVMPGLAVGLAVTGSLVESGANRAYGDYQGTADPGEIQRYYDEARNRDRIATILWASAEACAIAAVIAWILPEPTPTGSSEDER